jgi:Acetyltransferase (GNAT) domain
MALGDPRYLGSGALDARLRAFLDGEPVGAQGLSAVGFPVRREVATGSWLGLSYQRQGLGKEMRAAVLVLAFAHLGALSAVTGAFTDNTAALKVSKALGYHDDGHQVAGPVPGEPPGRRSGAAGRGGTAGRAARGSQGREAGPRARRAGSGAPREQEGSHGHRRTHR